MALLDPHMPEAPKGSGKTVTADSDPQPPTEDVANPSLH